MWRSRHGSGPEPHNPLFCSRCGSGGSDGRGVDEPSIGIQQSFRILPDLESLQDAVEGAVVCPDTAPMVGALPGTVTLRKVPPGGTAAQNPEDCIEHLPWVTPLAPGGLRGRKKITNKLPLPRMEFISFCHWVSIAAEGSLVILRQNLDPCPVLLPRQYPEFILGSSADSSPCSAAYVCDQ